MGDQPAGYQRDKFSVWREKEKMADWDDIINNRITMQCASCYAMHSMQQGLGERRA